MDITEQALRDAVSKSKTITEVATLVGFTYLNGRVQKKLNALFALYGIDVSHLGKANRGSKYPTITKTCPVCSKKFETQVGNKEERVTCSYACSNVNFSNLRHTAEANEKRRQAVLTNPNIKIRIAKEKKCEWCDEKFLSKFDKRFCNNKCASSFRMNQPGAKEKHRDIQNALVAAGTHKGWQSRSKMKQSWPEIISEQCITELGFVRGLEYKIELPVGRWFVDFAFVERKIAIEIDGKQHQYPERVVKDKEKDAYLSSEGWAVHRISWKKLTKDTRRELKDKLTDILIQ